MFNLLESVMRDIAVYQAYVNQRRAELNNVLKRRRYKFWYNGKYFCKACGRFRKYVVDSECVECRH